VRVQRELTGPPESPVALTIGNFDGVHRGHQAMLARLVEAADDLQLPPAVLTFEPHPREFFAPASAPPRLSTLRAKLDLFRAYGVATTYVARFDQRLASQSAADFVRDVLEAGLQARWVLVGEDFRFGRGREGDLAFLRRSAARFSIEAMGTVDVAGERASSTAVRAALAAGDLARAAVLLGRNYAVTGRVAHGDRLGRELGYPTANLATTPHAAIPADGVYAARLVTSPYTAHSETFPAAVSIGTNPTFDGVERRVEAFVLDRDDLDLYDERVMVEFTAHIRPTLRFESVDELLEAMASDVERCRELLARIVPA
jgi:riboflavin kinase/FMN adenylyltransferase